MSCCEGWDINRSTETPVRYMPNDDNVDVIFLAAASSYHLPSSCYKDEEPRKVTSSICYWYRTKSEKGREEKRLSHRVLMFSERNFIFIHHASFCSSFAFRFCLPRRSENLLQTVDLVQGLGWASCLLMKPKKPCELFSSKYETSTQGNVVWAIRLVIEYHLHVSTSCQRKCST